MAKCRFWSFLLAAALLTAVSPGLAQAPTGDISGRVSSSDGQPLPGVTVEVSTSSAPGSRSVLTSETGDYLVPLLPPGTYTISFVLDGFQTLQRTLNVAGIQNARLDVTMSPAAISVSVDVVGEALPFVQTAQVAAHFKQQLMATLPTNRTIDAVLLMAPAVHPTGPRGAYTINGSQSYENLYILNGGVINENLRGMPMTPYIEDAIQEVTVATAGVSAEYGRFAGGVATAVTKSGGNSFGGSFRTTFANDNWRSLTPFQTTQLLTVPGMTRSRLKADRVVPIYEATIGGPVSQDRLWFFGAGRSQKQVEQRTTVGTNVPYERRNEEQRYEGKLTYTPKPGHSLQGSYFKLNQTIFNFTGSQVADLKSLTPQGQPQNMVSTQYTGVLTPNFSLSAQYSARHFALTNVGADTTDRIFGTLVLDLQRGWRYWSPTFCAGSACGDGDEQRNNENIIVKGSYFVSNSAYGTHNLVFGYDYFNDNIIANTHASGSDYRIRGASSIVRGSEIFPVFLPGATTLDFNPILKLSQGSDLRVHSLFANDTWRLNERVTLNVGLRLDKHDATDGDGATVGNDLSLSPRISTIWDPDGRGQWAVNAGFARYAMALTSNLAAATAQAGNAATYRWIYTGAPINADPTAATLTTTEAAVRQVFAWHDALGGNDRATQFLNLPGVNLTLDAPLNAPSSIEYSGGLSRALGQKGSVRADVVYRDFRNFYSLRTDRTTGTITNEVGTFDRNVVENSDVTDRRYIGLTTQASFDVSRQVSVGGNYTLSRAHGNLEGETVNGGPSGAVANNYPEYRVASWNYPDGDLSIDQRHRARMWATYNLPMSSTAGTMTFGLLQQFASGVPLAPVGIVPTSGMVPNPGYVTPLPMVEYYFEGRNPYRTEATYRTDLSVNYGHKFAGPELFFHGELLNVFNQYQACGCGENVFRNGGITDLTSISQAVSIKAPFNPYTTQPVRGQHWDLTPGFGQPQNTFGYTSPRIFRFSVGLRF
jgi:hypothetical protein